MYIQSNPAHERRR